MYDRDDARFRITPLQQSGKIGNLVCNLKILIAYLNYSIVVLRRHDHFPTDDTV